MKLARLKVESIWSMNRILVVDDDPNFREVLRHQLSDIGLEVEAVNSSVTAVQRCMEGDYCLIVADVTVPAVNALSYLQLIKLRRPKVPVLVLSAFSAMENVAAAFRYGADDLLEKPYELARFRRKVAHWIGQ